MAGYSVSTSYPNVIRSADPLLIRMNELTLLVNNTSFWAKIKYGIQFKGFMVYVSGIAMPVMEQKFEEYQLNGTGGTKRSEEFQKGVITKNTVYTITHEGANVEGSKAFNRYRDISDNTLMDALKNIDL